MMGENKTKPTAVSVEDFINQVENPKRKKDAFALLAFFEEVTQLTPVMWGESMIGFGSYDYTYKSGHGGTSFIVGFSPRRQNITLYTITGSSSLPHLVSQLGKVKTGTACIYVNKLEDIDLTVLKTILLDSLAYAREHYPPQDA